MTTLSTNMLISVSLPALAAVLAVPANAQVAATARTQAMVESAATGPQDSPPPISTAPEVTQDAPSEAEVVVTGFRGSLKKALNLKRTADVQLDAITADDIASFPEANIAESLQRIPGISIDRDNGEGRQISVRGLGGDFTRVRINDMEALSTNGVLSAGQTAINTSRSFDFNTFASELFTQAKVRKTPSANVDEGSLGATVDLNTPRPFDLKRNTISLNAADAYYTNGKNHSPRISGLHSNRFLDGRVGVALSGAFQNRDVTVSNYKRSTGNGDVLYRGSSWAGNEYPQRARFAAPTGTTFNQSVLTTLTRCTGVPTGLPGTQSNNQPIGTICTFSPTATTAVVTPGFYTSSRVTPAISNPLVIAAQTGSDPAAYAALYPAGFATPGRFDDSSLIFPSLPGLLRQDLKSKRIGMTGSFQFQLSDRTRLTMDGLYSKLNQTGDVKILETVGFGRNNTNATLNTLPLGATEATRRGLYPNRCTASATTATSAGQDCGGTTLVPGYNNSFNANNLDIFDYYNNPSSPGYAPNAHGINGLIPLIGSPTTRVLGANVTNGVVDYLKVAGLDWRSLAQRTSFKTEFKQLSYDLSHEFNDSFKMNLNAGWSRSITNAQATQVEFNALDRPEAYTYDSRGGGDMPIFEPGFDASNPANWGVVKGFSVMRNNLNTSDTMFRQVRADFDWRVNDDFSLVFGGAFKRFDYSTTASARVSDAINPTEKEAGATVASLGSAVSFGQGLKLAAGTPTTWFAPNIDAFSSTFGFDCNCINKFGDFRSSSLRSTAVGNNFKVIEEDTTGYVQANFRKDIFGQPFSGNFGLRIAGTKVTGSGLTPVGLPVSDTNSYTDFLPAANFSYEAIDRLVIRLGVSAVMSRPSLTVLSPTVSNLTVPNVPVTPTTTGGSLSVGNPQLSPFRSNNIDLALEYYFRPNSVFSVAVFNKQLGSYPQTVLSDGRLSDVLTPDSIAAVRDGLINQNQKDYIDANLPFTIRQTRDAPGGYLRGFEVNLQSDFWFLPGFLKNFGFQLNGTKIKSSLTYILDPGVRVGGVETVPPSFGKGPFLNASPEAVNFTLYYQDEQFTIRGSMAWRSDYATNYPIAAGACALGLQPPGNTTTPVAASATSVPCDSPLINDFVSAKGTLNFDAVATYNVTDFLTLRLEALNLTNEPDQRYAYSANPEVTNYASTGTQITFGARLKF